ncbi:MAG: segregation/condensation protein A [Candidatus Omnitrophota bacterium]
MTYKVKLDVFEGPLDLLLYLIRKEEADIFDIPIAKITEQYLQYLEYMKLLDLNIAGEFIVMAATLMHIKSRMLLPPDEQPPEEMEEEDPRTELVHRLIEYKKFKEAAGELAQMEAKRSLVFPRAVDEAQYADQNEGSYFEASIFDLINAFSTILKSVSKEAFLEVVRDEFTVEGKIQDLLCMLNQSPVLNFKYIFQRIGSKLELIATFLALLELIRLKEVVVRQKRIFGEIEVMFNPDNPKFKAKADVSVAETASDSYSLEGKEDGQE